MTHSPPEHAANRRVGRVCALPASALLFGSGSAAGAYHYGKQVDGLLPPDDRDCLFFYLVGVTEADPAVPGNAWFAVPRAAYGFKEIYALLLAARLAGSPVSVVTNGQLVCGYPQVITVLL
jgi:hypothetical protein